MSGTPNEPETSETGKLPKIEISIPINRMAAWLRVLLWLLPGTCLFLTFLMGNRIVESLGVSVSDYYKLALFGFASVSAIAGLFHALLNPKDNESRSVRRHILQFCFLQILVGPLICVTLGFAWCCMNPVSLR